MTSDDCETNHRNQMKSHYNEQDTINYTVNCQMLIIIRIFSSITTLNEKWICHFIQVSGRRKFKIEIKRTHILMSFSIFHANELIFVSKRRQNEFYSFALSTPSACPNRNWPFFPKVFVTWVNSRSRKKIPYKRVACDFHSNKRTLTMPNASNRR